eukprot:TRINITY_DN8218_c0_g1_i1.p1 TRINITY_DN8218_c0_g1~~TRINITY_DN8218_c0_g1_i1.p1  ORF type:complete len:454 (-),score=131.01 TRINITY_DN8218_c0_g1_i1:133-1494(-)
MSTDGRRAAQEEPSTADLVKNGRIAFLPYSATSAIGEIRDIPYKDETHVEFDTRKHRLDVYLPTAVMKSMQETVSNSNDDMEHKQQHGQATQPKVTRPVLIFVHGGGWQRGNRSSAIGLYQNVGKAFAVAGYVTVLPSYRVTTPNLATILRISFMMTSIIGAICAFLVSQLFPHISFFPGILAGLVVFWIVSASSILFQHRRDIISGARTTFPRHAFDVADAIIWVQKNIHKFGGDPEQIFFSGHSAGGHLVSLLALDKNYLLDRGFEFKSLKGVIGISGVYSSKLFVGNPFTRGMYMLRVFGKDSSKWDQWFSSNHVNGNAATTPPFLLLNASFDLGLVEHSKELEKKLKVLGVHVERYVFNYTHHGTIVTRIGGRSIMCHLLGSRIDSFIEQSSMLIYRVFGTSLQSTHDLKQLGVPGASQLRVTRVTVRQDSVSRTCVEFIEKILAEKQD